MKRGATEGFEVGTDVESDEANDDGVRVESEV